MPANTNPHRCQKSCYEGLEPKGDGLFGADISPHAFEIAETHKAVDVEVMRCMDCGFMEVHWSQPGKEYPVIERLDIDPEKL